MSRAGSLPSAHTLVAIAIGLLALAACQKPPSTPKRAPLLVVGVDGADPAAIRRLIQEGELPQLALLIEHGTFVQLKTAYGASPVIWTVMVTGVPPELNGIDDFVIVTLQGRIPITSVSRRRPALWNMLDRVHRRSAILGMWATWPAEETSGMVLSDRIGLGLESEIAPASMQPELDSWLERAQVETGGFPGGDRIAQNDRIVAIAARELLRTGGYDLLLAYMRSVDVNSHRFWHLFDPESFQGGLPSGLPTADSSDPVRAAYKAVDAAIGEFRAATGPDTSILVVSDHGFFAQTNGQPQLLLDLDRVLEFLGFARKSESGEVEQQSSKAWTVNSPSYSLVKQIHLNASLDSSGRAQTMKEISSALASCHFIDGGIAFDVSEYPDSSGPGGSDLVARTQLENGASRLACKDEEIPDAVVHFARITGNHGPQTMGTLIASGPIFARSATVPRATIFDIAPTILYALGLPTADDFSGRPLLDLFTPEFQRSNPERLIRSWGTRESASSAQTAEDQNLLEELAGLGYLQ